MPTLAQALYTISLLGFLFGEAVAAQEPARLVVGPNVRVSGDSARPYVEMMIAVNPADPDNLVGASMRVDPTDVSLGDPGIVRRVRRLDASIRTPRPGSHRSVTSRPVRRP